MLFDNDYGVLTFYAERIIPDLNNLIWKLGRGESIEYDFDTVKTLESAVDEIEKLRDHDIDEEDIFNAVAEWDDKEIIELEKDLREHRLWDVQWSKDNQVTIDDVAEQVMEWYGMNTIELKELASYRKLKQSGTKEDIVRRLKEKYLQDYEVVL